MREWEKIPFQGSKGFKRLAVADHEREVWIRRVEKN